MTDIHTSIIGQLKATQAGDPWYGACRAALLAGLTPAEAAAHPIRGRHSIWEIVLHMTAWTQEVERRLAGGAPAVPVMGDWPEVEEVSAPGWAAAQSALEHAHGELMARLDALPPEAWMVRVGDEREAALGTGVDVAGMLVGLGQHDAYHTGQVATLRGAIAANSSEPQPAVGHP